ncbi:MAG TPA: hypothetical protein PK802_04155 [Candidatus Cloacimonadota bacterium]|nr:hypothetical protein [Candidatus Cloacimonadota bacterium]HOG31036.1 hypothetical protein [Candidatus Cloacimonadota bacterium]HOR59116.1 hypothetical protein [Candidatus Cloacimonadota bacterium]HPB08867.1 hypothetical protein [Candidatus Cloacimonadota bacterium]HPL23398.1 hypothetical protein [Candidatus Cloacimonadota bacterium]
MKKLASLCALLCALSFLGAADGEFYAANQSVFVIPTAYMMPKGSSSFTDYELVILQFSFAPSNRLHLSAGMGFPYNVEMAKTITAGAKFNYFQAPSMESAAWGTFTPIEEVYTLGNVVSFGNNSGNGGGSLHLAGMLYGDMDKPDYLWAVLGTGGIVRISNRVNGMVDMIFPPLRVKDRSDDTDSEYDDESDNYGVFIAGVRIKGKMLSVDLGGMRFVGDGDHGDILLMPFVKASIMF